MVRLNRNNLFLSGELSQGIGRKAARGGMSLIICQGSSFLLNIVRLAVLARLLYPSDFGLVGMVLAVVAFANIFKDAGLSWATVQRPEIDHRTTSNLFWLNVIVSLGISLCLVATSPLIARFYGEPRLVGITLALAVTLLINGFAIQHTALLRRHMKFAWLAFISVATQAVAILATVIMALAGLGHWAIVWGNLVAAVCTVALTYAFCPWVPGPMTRGAGTRGMLTFGGQLTGSAIVEYFARNTDHILIGKYLGATALGFYGRAYQMLMVPINLMAGPLSSVAIPTLSRLKHDNAKMCEFYLHMLYLLCLFAVPLSAMGFVVRREVVEIWLGPMWLPAVSVFMYLCIAGLVKPLYIVTWWLHAAAGRSDRVLRASLLCTPVVVLGIVIGLAWGMDGVALGYSLAMLVITPASLAYAGRSVNLKFRRMLGVLWRPMAACVGAMLAASALDFVVAPGSLHMALLMKMSAYVFAQCLLLLVLYRGFKPVRDVLSLGRMMISRPKNEPAV